MLQQAFGEAQVASSDRQVISVPDVIDKNNTKEISIPQKFKADIDALKTYLKAELESGLCINLTLSKILKICPRERKRVDAYTSLSRYLKDKLGVELNIKSQKTK